MRFSSDANQQTFTATQPSKSCLHSSRIVPRERGLHYSPHSCRARSMVSCICLISSVSLLIPLFSLCTLLNSSHTGITNIGVLVWTVAPDSEASLYKTLIANTEVRFTVYLEYYSIALHTHHTCTFTSHSL